MHAQESAIKFPHSDMIADERALVFIIALDAHNITYVVMGSQSEASPFDQKLWGRCSSTFKVETVNCGRLWALAFMDLLLKTDTYSKHAPVVHLHPNISVPNCNDQQLH